MNSANCLRMGMYSVGESHTIIPFDEGHVCEQVCGACAVLQVCSRSQRSAPKVKRSLRQVFGGVAGKK